MLISLTNLQELADLAPLAELQSLQFLSLVNNPVQKKEHYRAFLIYSLPKLRVLDFKKVKKQEREAAQKLFAGESGKKLYEELVKSKSTV